MRQRARRYVRSMRFDNVREQAMNANVWSRSRRAQVFVWCWGAGASAASAVEVPDYVGFVSHRYSLPNPDRPYEMISGAVNYRPDSLFSLYDLEFRPSDAAQLDFPSRNAEGNFEFDSKFDITYRAVVSFGLEPAHPIRGTGQAHAVGRATGGQWPLEPLVYGTEVVGLALDGAGPRPEGM